MWDRILEIGSIFDWISPVLAFLEDVANGPSHTFLVPLPCAWSGLQIDGLLKGYGIRVWGLMIVENKLMLTVRKAQARWAQYLLEREGIRILNPFVQTHRSPPREAPAPAPQPSLLFKLDSWIDRLG